MRMFRTTIVIFLAFFLLVVSGCAYVDTKTPLDENLDQTTLGTKTGVAEAYSVLWMVAWGDASYAAAAKQQGIKTLYFTDQEVISVMGVYSSHRVLLYGEPATGKDSQP